MMARTEFCLLGPLVVRCGGVPVPVRPGKQRAVLALLLLNPGQVVAQDEIAEALWGFAPPPSARVTVRNYVSRLRQALQDTGRDRISTEPRGYAISLDADELDITRFEVLAATAQSAIQSSSWERAATQARSALALWRGEPLADVGSEVLTAREVPRLAEARLQALEARIDADVHLGRQAGVIAELQRLVATHPLREHLHSLLMLAFYRCGRQAEALAAYQSARGILIEELGTEPAAELRELHQRILRGDADPIQAAGRGHGVSAGDGPAARRSQPAGPGFRTSPVPRQLPAAGAHFVGRETELSVLMSLAERAASGPGEDGTGRRPRLVPGSVPIVAIGGTAGVGKTALALHFAHLVADRFSDGQLYLNLRGFDPSVEPLPPSAAVRSFLDGLNVPPEQIPASLDAQTGLYRSMLAGRQMLIVLDNAASADQVRSLLPGAGHCLVVVTSRRQLTALAALEGASSVTLDVLIDSEAYELLAARLGADRLASDPAATAELITECARLPLALSVAAARAQGRPQFSLAAVASELRDARGRLDALDGGEASINVRAVFSWSYHQLPPASARMFSLLGLHPGPDITVAAAASLAAVPHAQAGQALGQLTTACLLTEHVPGRFAFHDLLRAYAAEGAAATENEDQRQDAIGRLADHYLQSARAADQAIYPARPPVAIPGPQPGTQPETFSSHAQALDWFDREHYVLRAVISLAAAADLHACAWQLPWAMETFFYRRAHWHDWAVTQIIALTAARRIGDRDGEAHAHRGIANANIENGSHEEGLRHLALALRLREKTGDLAGQARIHLDMARSAVFQQRYDDYLNHARRGLELSRSVHDHWGEGNALSEVAWALALLGHYEQAIAGCQEALRLYRQVGSRPHEGQVWDTLGFAHHHLGHHAKAAACYRRAVQILDDHGYLYNKAVTLTWAGEAYRAAGDAQAAREAWRQALAILKDTRHPHTARVLANLDDLATAAGLARQQTLGSLDGIGS
jgi:DNA-binding SARP family transcriptional activator